MQLSWESCGDKAKKVSEDVLMVAAPYTCLVTNTQRGLKLAAPYIHLLPSFPTTLELEFRATSFSQGHVLTHLFKWKKWSQTCSIRKRVHLDCFIGQWRLVLLIGLCRGCFHYLNKLNLLLQGFEKNILKVYKIISFSSKILYWQRWINVNNNFILPNSFQVYLVKQGTSKRKRVTGVICVRYLCR